MEESGGAADGAADRGGSEVGGGLVGNEGGGLGAGIVEGGDGLGGESVTIGERCALNSENGVVRGTRLATGFGM